jgi:predicted methyltransferase
MEQVTETFRNVMFGAASAVEQRPPAESFAPTRSGQRTVKVTREDGREAWLHSRHDPLGEAHAQTAEVAIGDLDTVFLVGMGLGYPALALAARLGAGNHLVVIERSRALFEEAIATPGFIDLLRRPRTLFFVGAAPDEL